MLGSPVSRRFIVLVCGAASLAVAACSPSHGTSNRDGSTSGDPDGSVITDDAGVIIPPPPTSDGGVTTHDPATCAEAAMLKSYIGCDYWPTVTGNAVWNVFDYAVVISNPGTAMASVTVSGGALGTPTNAQVAPGQLVKIGLPWVTALKGPQANSKGGVDMPMVNSVFATKGAYHLVSDVPVLVYQFNALEYKPGTGNNLTGVAWSTCPAQQGLNCLSYSNDASLLLPSTAMSKNYVVTGVPGDDTKITDLNGTSVKATGSSYAVVTATVDGTMITMQLSKTGDVVASTDNKITAIAQNATTPAKATYMLNAGDVIELLTKTGSAHDLTGSIIQATQPVQLVVGKSCTTNPMNEAVIFTGSKYTCDHIEETVLPVETWGKTYGVTAPTGPDAKIPGHTVRIYGGVTAANLTYTPAVTGAPATIQPGAVAVFEAPADFVVAGDHEFAVSSEQRSGQVVDSMPGNDGARGDPSLSFLSAMEQYRDKYLFLAPTDYDVNFVDIVMPLTATLTLDGVAVTQAPTALGAGYGALHLPLTAGMSGAHTLTGTAPFGIQVLGYGLQTSYQYPGGLDLKVISAPPPPIL